MRLLKFVLWTSFAIGLGIFAASYEFDGRTPVQHAQQLWKRQQAPQRLDQVKEGITGAIADARRHAAGKADEPVEHHSDADKESINRLLAKRPSK